MTNPLLRSPIFQTFTFASPEQEALARELTSRRVAMIRELLVEHDLPVTCFAEVAQMYMQQISGVLEAAHMKKLEVRDAKVAELRKFRSGAPLMRRGSTSDVPTMGMPGMLGGCDDGLDYLCDADLDAAYEDMLKKKQIKPV